MVGVAWASKAILAHPKLKQYRGGDDIEALIAISKFTGVFAVDLSGTLEWPFPTERISDFSISAFEPLSVGAVMDTVGAAAWDGVSELTVFTSGDTASMGVLAALLKHKPDGCVLKLRYNITGSTYYSLLFAEIASNYAIETEFVGSAPLTENLVGHYLDGRSGDDIGAEYFWLFDARLGDVINDADTTNIFQRLASDSAHPTAVIAGLQKFADNCPFPVVSAWSFIVAMYRFCVTQADVLNAASSQFDSIGVYQQRLAFYDDPAFTAVSRFASQALPSESETVLNDIKEYVASTFPLISWSGSPDASRPYAANTNQVRWLSASGESHPYSKLPLIPELPATWAQIEYWRDFQEVAPIETSLGYFHADNLSVEIRMKGSIEQFDSLPTLNPDGTLTWKQPGQIYVTLTQAELQQAYNEIKLNGAVRSATLHVKAAMFRQMITPPTPAQMSALAFWMTS